MDLNQWSFALSIAGLILGVVSAYPQLRNFIRRTFKAGTQGAQNYLAHLNAQADFYIDYPSALIAYLVKGVLLLAVLFALGAVLLNPASPSYLNLPSWLRLLIQLVSTFVVGKIGGDLLNIVRLVIRRARQRHANGPSGG